MIILRLDVLDDVDAIRLGLVEVQQFIFIFEVQFLTVRKFVLNLLACLLGYLGLRFEFLLERQIVLSELRVLLRDVINLF